jgi:HupE / UreJ protein
MRVPMITAAAVAGLALWLAPGAALAHRIDSLSVVADFSRDGSEMSVEISAEARRILEATESLSLLPRFLAGGASAEAVEAEVFAKAAEYFPARVGFVFDGRTRPLPPLEFSRLEVDEKDAVDPSQAAGAADRKHVFIVGRHKGSVPPGARSFQVDVTGDTVVVVTIKLGGQQVGRVVPEFPGMRSRAFALGIEPEPGTEAAEAHGFWYFVLQGFRHIVPEGLDHILFVLGLFFLSRSFKPLLWQITAFTVAHSITLALAMLDIVRLPSQPVEVAIAISIAFVAIENLFRQKLTVWRPLVVFAFGLVHGLGFAGAFKEMLGESDEPATGEFVRMLVGFNLGVEFGQLAVVAAAFALAGAVWKKEWYRARVAIPASLVIACFGIYWAITRMIEPA